MRETILNLPARTRLLRLGLLIATLASTGAFAQSRSDSAADKVPEGEELVNIDFPEPTDIKDIIRAVALWTGKNIIIDKSVTGKVQMISPKKVTKEEAYQAFLSALSLLKLTTVETGKVIKIMTARSAIRDNLQTYQGADWAPRTDNTITQIVPLKYIDAKQIRDRLARIMGGNEIMAYEPTNTLIISASGYKVRRILSIIDLLDVKGQQPQVVIVPIRNGDAKVIAGQVKTLLDTSRASSKKRKATGDYKILPDERSNSVVVFGPPRTISDVKNMIKKFDFPVDDPSNQASIRVRFLDYVDAKKLATTLSSLTATRTNTTSNRVRRLGSRRTTNKAPPVANLGGNVKITADENSNSLLITGSRSAYEALNTLIRKLDRRRAQVYIETDILDINLEDGFEFGSSILTGLGREDGSGTNVSIGWQGDNGINSVIGAQVGNSATDRAAAARALTQKLTIGVLAGTKVKIPGLGDTTISPGGLVTLLKRDSNSRVLSSPHLLTTNNEEAKILVGDTLFFKTAVESNVSAGGNIQKVEKENADLTLLIKPTVSNSGNYVTMKIDLEQNDGTLNADKLPNIRKRQSKSVVTVKNGQTAVISGLMQSREEESVDKIPLLGDIPILGWLFRNSLSKKVTSSLMIFMTPHIVYGGNDLAAIYKRKLKEQNELMKVAFNTEQDEANRRWLPPIEAGQFVPDGYDKHELKKRQQFLEELRKDMGYSKADIEDMKVLDEESLEQPVTAPPGSYKTDDEPDQGTVPEADPDTGTDDSEDQELPEQESVETSYTDDGSESGTTSATKEAAGSQKSGGGEAESFFEDAEGQ